MASSRLTGLPALRKQHLLVEFAGLKQACPDGIFVSLTPGDASLWSGVLFVRDGPYAPAVMRFQISFPDAYPRYPPLVTFSTDMFHPLITPLSTHMFTPETQDGGGAGAIEFEPLPPGGYSLRHGFPHWFGRQARGNLNTPQSSAQQSQDVVQTPPRPPPKDDVDSLNTLGISKVSPVAKTPGFAETQKKDVSMFEVLRYIRSTFDDQSVVDSIPLSAAGNPGAWYAWRTYRAEKGMVFPDTAGGNEPSSTADPSASSQTAPDSAKRPGEWNWEGVWETRVNRAISASVSEAVLFSGAGPSDDIIHFLNMDDNDLEAVKGNILRAVGHAP